MRAAVADKRLQSSGSQPKLRILNRPAAFSCAARCNALTIGQPSLFFHYYYLTRDGIGALEGMPAVDWPGFFSSFERDEVV